MTQQEKHPECTLKSGSCSLTFLSSEVIFSEPIQVTTQPTGLIIVLFFQEYLNVATGIHLHLKAMLVAVYFIVTCFLLHK